MNESEHYLIVCIFSYTSTLLLRIINFFNELVYTVLLFYV